MPSTIALDVCMYCGHPEVGGSPGELNCWCGRGEPCPNCGHTPCRCSPSLCCGAPWSPLDWKIRRECYICGEPVTRNADGVVYRVRMYGDLVVTQTKRRGH